MNTRQFQGLIRHGLTFGAGAAVTAGYLSEAESAALLQNAETIIGAIAGIVGIIWSASAREKRAGTGDGSAQ